MPPQSDILALPRQQVEGRLRNPGFCPRDRAIGVSSRSFDQVESERDDVKVRLIDAAAGETARGTAAMLKAEDLLAMHSEGARDRVGDFEELCALIRTGL